MWLSDISVKRPVFATVLALMLVAFGSLAYQELPVREYPDITPPIISVRANYPGASAEVVENRVTQMLESAISGIEGAKSIQSRSSDGSASVSVEFDLARDIDEAANDVRDRVSRVMRRLPQEVDPPIVSKQDSDARPVMFIGLYSESVSLMELTDFAERYIRDRFANIAGVSQININGTGRPSMRIWLGQVTR